MRSMCSWFFVCVFFSCVCENIKLHCMPRMINYFCRIVVRLILLHWVLSLVMFIQWYMTFNMCNLDDWSYIHICELSYHLQRTLQHTQRLAFRNFWRQSEALDHIQWATYICCTRQVPGRCSILLRLFCQGRKLGYWTLYSCSQHGSVIWFEPASNSPEDIEATQRAQDFQLDW